MFHGAFPDRFENRPGGIARDVATGELVADQLVAAAESDLYDSIEVSVDNVRRGGGGCVAVVPVLPGGGPLDPTLPALVGLLVAYLVFGRRRPVRQAALVG